MTNPKLQKETNEGNLRIGRSFCCLVQCLNTANLFPDSLCKKIPWYLLNR